MEALPILSTAEAEEEGSDERQAAEEMAMERVSLRCCSGIAPPSRRMFEDLVAEQYSQNSNKDDPRCDCSSRLHKMVFCWYRQHQRVAYSS